MKRHSPVLRHTLVASLLACTALAAQAQDKPVELKFAHWLPPTHPLARTGFEPWAKSVEAASKGSIKVAFFPAQQLGKAADHYDMARDGIADLTWVNPGYQAGRFPMMAAGELPFLMSKPGPGSAALDKWYRGYASQEMKDVRLCFAHVHIGTMHSKKPITEPGQLKGMKIRSANGTVSQTMTLLGATNVQVSAPEARDALEKGVADAITFPWGSMTLFGIDKVVKYHMDVPLYVTPFVWVMNKDKYNALSASQKAAVDSHCTSEWAEKVGSAWADEVYKLTPEQLAEWKKAVAPTEAQWANDVKKAGYNADEVIKGLRSSLAKYKSGL